MYVAKSKYSNQAYFGKTLTEAYDNLAEDDSSALEDCIFFKAEAIKVELQEVTVVKKVPVATKTTVAKKGK
jgi:hypothetical protein